MNSKNRKKLIECNLKLVLSIAKDYFKQPLESLTPIDLVPEIGFRRADRLAAFGEQPLI